MATTEEDMLISLKQAVLEEIKPELCKKLTPRDHYPYLRSKYILSKDDEEEIELQGITRQKVHKMLDILATKGGSGFDGLVESLIDIRTQMFLAQKLNKAYEEKRKRLRNILQNSPRDSCDNSVLPVLQSVQHDSSTITTQVGDRSSISDLGVDTDKLPKPVMTSEIELSKMVEKLDDDSLHIDKLCGDVSKQEKPVEEHEDECAGLNIREYSGESKA